MNRCVIDEWGNFYVFFNGKQTGPIVTKDLKLKHPSYEPPNFNSPNIYGILNIYGCVQTVQIIQNWPKIIQNYGVFQTK